MTENEAIKVLVTQKQCIDKSSSGQCKINCGDCKKNIPIAYQEKSYEVAITAIKEIQQYREIGTVEECREAAENQKAKNPSVHKQQYSDAYNCSKCGWTFIHKNETGWFCGQHYKFCPNCGQAIRWNENLEGMEDEGKAI